MIVTALPTPVMMRLWSVLARANRLTLTGARLRVWLVAVAGIVFLGLHTTPVRADVWGYVDAKGVAHFAVSQLDAHYELFFRASENSKDFYAGKTDKTLNSEKSENRDKSEKSNEKMSTQGAAAQISPIQNSLQLSPGSAFSPPKILAYFDVSPNYKAVKHLLKDASLKFDIDFELLQAVIATESGFNTHAVSPKGAVGLMQLIPPTAERYGVKADKNAAVAKKLTDPQINIKVGARYLSDLIRLFPGQLELALASYNAGPGAVQRAGNKIPNYPETINYVKTVMQLYVHLKPPVVVLEARKTAGRVRMEMMGGATGRGNMLPATTAQRVSVD